MKLLIAIVQDEDSSDLIDELTAEKFQVTKLATTGGFLKEGNTTLLIGVEKEKVDKVLSIIEDICQPRKEILAPTPQIGADIYIPMPLKITVGGAIVFVVDVDKFVKI